MLTPATCCSCQCGPHDPSVSLRRSDSIFIRETKAASGFDVSRMLGVLVSEDSPDDLHPEPFLLIVRTPRIVTVRLAPNEYRGIHRSSQHIAKFINVTTTVLIVTAAVYRGFDQELRPEGLTPSINLPAPGRRHTLYVLLRVCRVLCF